ncbi:MAG: hypothetical protein A2Z99_21610 [Treponema sp. GWB1_62_6]|nr:MAG: hypothetical protein A2Z99_21610 [Treponema sp. GWB1_62_6]
MDALAYVFGPEAAGSEAAGPGPEALLAVRRPGRGMDLAAAMEAGLVSRENLAPDLLALSAAERPAWVEFEAELELSGGAPVAISTSWIARGHVNDFRIVVEGSDASAELDFNRSHTGIELRKRSGEASVLEGEGEPSTYDRFLDAVKNGSRPRPDFDDALGVQRILDALLPGGLPL